MSEHPSVSVLMSARDAVATVALAVRSIRAQTLSDWELLVCDDGSRDGTIAALREAAGDDPRVRVTATGTPAGLAARLNELVTAARGAYIARMDADDVAFPERLTRQVRYLAEHPEIDLLGTSMVIVDGAGCATGWRPAPAGHDAICARPLAGFPLFHPTWCGRADWFRRQPYDPHDVRAEDQALLLRAHRSSRFANLAEPLLAYREDALRWRSLARGRFSYARAAVLHAPSPLSGATALAGQMAKAAVDLTAISTGTERRLLRHRARPLPPEQAAAWRAAHAAVRGTAPG